MAPVVVFLEDDWEMPQQPLASGEDWDQELLVPAQ
jgi:hypothetical protein